jgi:predicted ATPase
MLGRAAGRRYGRGGTLHHDAARHSTRHRFANLYAWGLSYRGVLAVKRGDLKCGLPLLRASLDEVRGSLSHVIFPGMVAEALVEACRASEGIAAVDAAIDRSERNGERWVTAELLRVKGELLLLRGAAAATVAAEDHFRQALDWAHRQGALSWELRAGMSLARLQRDQDCVGEARDLLSSVYGRFTEGFGTAYLRAVRLLLDELTDDPVRERGRGG